MTSITLPKFRLGYVDLAQKILDKDKNIISRPDSFVAVALFDEAAQITPEFKALVQAMQLKAVESFGAKAAEAELAIKRTNKDGSLPAGLPEGGVFFRMTTGYMPELVKLSAFKNMLEIVKPLDDMKTPEDFYAGCYCSALVSVYPTGNKKVLDKSTQREVWAPPRIQVRLEKLLKLEDGERIQSANQVSASDAFAAFVVPGAAPAQAAGMPPASDLPSY